MAFCINCLKKFPGCSFNMLRKLMVQQMCLQRALRIEVFKHQPSRRLFSQSCLRASESDSTPREDETEQLQGSTVKRLPRAVAERFKIFRDEDAEIILDVNEEKFAAERPSRRKETHEDDARFAGINLERGVTGVFEIKELVEVLRAENTRDICVIGIPREIKYADYMVVVTGRSARHMTAVAEFVRKLFKKKMQRGDLIPRIEGENCRDWIALDLGNIVLHIFNEEARKKYSIETLWTVGAEFDDLCNEPADPIAELLDGYDYLRGFSPAS